MNDNEIIRLYWSRDQIAIACTQEKYGHYCYRIAWNILYDHEDSEECVNDTYMETWNAIPPARPFSLKAFVGRLTRNNALNRYERNTAKKRGGPAGTLCLEELGECVSGKDDLHDRIDYEHLVTSINSFLSLLSKEQRIIFVRRYFYESSIREIAEDYGLSESKVKVTLSRLTKRLRESLEKEGIQV